MKMWQRILASVGIVLLCTVLVLCMLVALARSARVQTAALSVFSGQLSRGLGATVEVGNISYKFPNRLIVEHVYVEDRQRDTLLYVDTLSAYADLIRFLREDTLCIHEVGLSGGYFNAYPETDSTMNYRFLVDAFSDDEERERDSAFHINLQVRDIRLSRLRVRYDTWRGSLPLAKMHVHNITPHLFDVEIGRLSAEATHNGVPFSLLSAEAHLIINDTLVTFPKLHARFPESDLHVEEFVINRADAKRLRESAPKDSVTRAAVFGKTALDLTIDDATFTPYDFRALVPRFATMRQKWSVSADVSGRVDSIEAHGLRLRYRDADLLTGDLTAFGLPNADSAFVRAQCRDFHINKALLQDIISGATGKPLLLPDIVGKLGEIHYRGALQGRADNLILKGALTTALGSIKTDGHAVLTFADDTLRSERSVIDVDGIVFRGVVSTRRFHLGRALGNSDLGTIGLNVVADGDVGRNRPFTGSACLNIEHAVFRGYTYHGIHVDGTFRNRVFSGEMHSTDENLAFDFVGSADLNEDSPDYDFRLQLSHLRLGQLNLSEKYADSDMRCNLDVQLHGSTLAHITGFAALSDAAFYHLGDSLVINRLTVRHEETPVAGGRSRRLVRVDSKHVTASCSGEYDFTTLKNSVLRLVATHLPHVFPDRLRKEFLALQSDNSLDFYVYARELEEVSRVFDLPVTLGDRPTIKGHLDDRGKNVSVQAVVPDITGATGHIEDLTFAFDNRNDRLNLSLFGMRHHGSNPTAEHIGDIQLYLNARAARDTVLLTANWSNPDTVHNAGELNLVTAFSRYADKPLISARFLPSEILLSDSLWHLSPSQVTYTAADTIIVIDDFRFGSTSQHIFANGVISTNKEDTVFADLAGIDLDYFLGALTDVHRSIFFGGTISGWAKAYGILRRPMFEAEVTMLHAKINDCEVGDIYASATLDSLNHVIILGDAYDTRLPADNPQGGRHVVRVEGKVTGTNGRWDLGIYPDSVEVNFINYWCKDFLSDMRGRASGAVHVWGFIDPVTRKPGTWVTVSAMAHDIGITVPYTGGRYYVNDSVVMDSVSLSFPNMTLHDEEGHLLTFDGKLEHDGTWAHDLRFNFDISAHRAIVLDIPATSTDLYGGKVYADGRVSISGNDKECHIVADAVTTAGSSFDFVVDGAGSASDNRFVEFVDHTYKPELNDKPKSQLQPVASRLYLTLQVEVTPQTEVTVLLDRHTGDKLRGRGAGNIKLTYSDADDFALLGTFILQQGTFGFTFQNVIRREFQIAEGSRVTWNGAPDNPEVDIRALYRVTASLRDLFGSETNTVTNRSSIPVNCLLNLSDRLMNPLLRFGIELPSSDESVNSQVRAVINTDEMLMRQVLYLLVFNRFYTPEYLQNTANVGLNETYSLLSSTVTGQINSWLSRMTDIVSVGFNFRTDGEGADSSQEYEAQFEIHPVRGLLINGNFGYRYNDISNQPIFGNLDVEYMLTQDGKLRAKAYTHTVDKYSLRQANTVQGVGFVFKHEFNWPKPKAKEDKKAKSDKKSKASAKQ